MPSSHITISFNTRTRERRSYIIRELSRDRPLIIVVQLFFISSLGTRYRLEFAIYSPHYLSVLHNFHFDFFALFQLLARLYVIRENPFVSVLLSRAASPISLHVRKMFTWMSIHLDLWARIHHGILSRLEQTWNIARKGRPWSLEIEFNRTEHPNINSGELINISQSNRFSIFCHKFFLLRSWTKEMSGHALQYPGNCRISKQFIFNRIITFHNWCTECSNETNIKSVWAAR